MAKSFYTNGIGNQQTLTNSQDEKIPIYDNLTDAQSDLSNLEEGQIIGTKTPFTTTSITDTIQSGDMNAVTSNAVSLLKRGLLYDTGLLNLIDNTEQTVYLSSSRMYLFVNIHAVSGQEIIILNCYNGNLRQTRITHAYDGNDTTISNSGQYVTFKANGTCRGHLLALTDYTTT